MLLNFGGDSQARRTSRRVATTGRTVRCRLLIDVVVKHQRRRALFPRSGPVPAFLGTACQCTFAGHSRTGVVTLGAQVLGE